MLLAAASRALGRRAATACGAVVSGWGPAGWVAAAADARAAMAAAPPVAAVPAAASRAASSSTSTSRGEQGSQQGPSTSTSSASAKQGSQQGQAAPPAPRRTPLEARIGFLGAGQMGEAMIKGFLSANVTRPSKISASVLTFERQALLESLGIGKVFEADAGGAQKVGGWVGGAVGPPSGRCITPHHHALHRMP